MLVRILACVTLVLCAPVSARAQNQQSGHQPGWPCSGKVDPSYVRMTEATGGRLLLFGPNEATAAANEWSASRGHPVTVTRVGGSLDGADEFEVPLDSTIESVYFFVALQCLQDARLIEPSGEALRLDAPEVRHHAFDAVRLFVVKSPRPGKWKVAVSGRGIFSLIVSAKTDIALTVSFLQDGVPIKGLAPLGKPVRLQAALSGAPQTVVLHFISMNGALLGEARIERGEGAESGIYEADVTLPRTEFRVAATGLDANGVPFQRVAPQLFVDR